VDTLEESPDTRGSARVKDSSDPPRPFTVVIADNFHYMDEGESYEHGKFETLEDAIAAAKGIVDRFLVAALKPGMSAEQLYSQYTSFGDDPYIRGSKDPGIPFSAWNCAKTRCLELCSPEPRPKPDGHDG
jgi:hypothetical protein